MQFQKFSGLSQQLEQLQIKMKIEIVLQIKGIRCLKGLFSTFSKLLFSNKQKADCYLIYFCESKHLRFLIHSETICVSICAIDPRMIISDKSSMKEKAELLAIQFKDGGKILQAFCDMADRQGFEDITMNLSKDKPNERDQEPFRSLNIFTSTDKFRAQIFKPLYDPPTILNHPFLNGCASDQYKKIQFDIDTQHFLNLLRLIYKNKEAHNIQKMITVEFLFLQDKFIARLQKLQSYCQAQVAFCNFSSPKYQGNYFYKIRPQNAGKVYQLLMGKSSGSRIFIDMQNRLIFNYAQDGVYESQMLTKEWIVFHSFETKHRMHEMKLEI